MVSYSSVVLFQYMSLGFLYKFLWKPLVNNIEWAWPAQIIYTVLALVFLAFMVLVSYVKDGSVSPAHYSSIAGKAAYYQGSAISVHPLPATEIHVCDVHTPAIMKRSEKSDAYGMHTPGVN